MKHREDQYPRGLSARTGHVVKRSIRSTPFMTTDEFRLLTYAELNTWKNCGPSRIADIQKIQREWTDEELVRAFEFWVPRQVSPRVPPDDLPICNWVGEGVPLMAMQRGD